jgi:hypothetical protein
MYNKEVEQEHFPIDPLTQQTFIPDLVPMYQLSEPEYQAIVMGLSNLMVAIVQELHARGQGELAGRIATHTHGVLVAFDEDVAEVVRAQGSGCVRPV